MKKLSVQDLAMFIGCEVETPDGRSFLNSVDYRMNTARTYFRKWHPYGRNYHIDIIKPILSPLSGMTQQENTEWETYRNNLYKEGEVLTWENMRRQDAEFTKYLISKHFDVFGWIENGLAIKK